MTVDYNETDSALKEIKNWVGQLIRIRRFQVQNSDQRSIILHTLFRDFSVPSQQNSWTLQHAPPCLVFASLATDTRHRFSVPITTAQEQTQNQHHTRHAIFILSQHNWGRMGHRRTSEGCRNSGYRTHLYVRKTAFTNTCAGLTNRAYPSLVNRNILLNYIK